MSQHRIHCRLTVEELEPRIAPGVLTINDVAQVEGNSGTTDIVFTVSLSSTTGVPVMVDYATPNGSFGAATTFRSGGSNPRSVAIGDFNGDSKSDLAVPNYNSDTVGVLIGNGEGTFAGAVTFGSGGSGPNCVAIGDFNGDSKSDLAVTNDNSDNVAVLLGNGNGTFKTAVTFASGGTYPNYIDVADFNGDSKSDLVVSNTGNYSPGVVGVLLGNGNGTFAGAVTYGSGGTSAYVVAIGDFNGDSKSDLAVANIWSDNVGILLGNGNGTFAGVVTLASGGGLPHSVAIGDFNGDSKSDLAVANYRNDNVGVLLGNGNGTFNTAVKFGSGGSLPQSVDVADFNGDSKSDLVVTNKGSDNVGVLLGNGNGTFKTAVTFASGGSLPNYVAIGDFNGDSITDLAVSNSVNDNVGVLLSNIGTASPGTDYTVVRGTLTIAVGQTSGTIGVPIIGDVVYEADETFYLNLSNPVNATIADPQGMGTILNDDSLPPAGVELLASSDTGVSNSDNLTNLDNSTSDKGLTFRVPGTVTGATVTLYCGGQTIGSALAAGATTDVTTNGAFDLTDGVQTITATQTELGKGQSTDSPAITVTIDTVAPPMPNPPDLDAASDSGFSSTDNITNTTAPTFAVTSGAPYFRFCRDGVQISADYESGTQYTAGPQGDGTYLFALKAVDLAGNASAASPDLSVTIDTQAAPPSIPDLEAASDSGRYNDDNYTKDNTPTLDLTGFEYSYVLYRNGAPITPFGSTAGQYTEGTLADTAYTYALCAVDRAGNTSGTSTGLTLTIDTTAPPLPNAPDLDASSDSGLSNTDDITNDTTPTLNLSGFEFSYLLSRDGAVIAPLWSTAGQFTEGVPLPDGTQAHTYALSAVDVAGNTSSASAGLTVTIDTVAPAVPSASLSQASDGALSSFWNDDNSTPLRTPAVEFSGITAGDRYRLVRDGGVTIGDSTGTGYTEPSNLDYGPHTYELHAVDPAGNVSEPSDPLAILIAQEIPLVAAKPRAFSDGDAVGTKITITLTGPTAGHGFFTLKNGLLNGAAFAEIGLQNTTDKNSLNITTLGGTVPGTCFDLLDIRTDGVPGVFQLGTLGARGIQLADAGRIRAVAGTKSVTLGNIGQRAVVGIGGPVTTFTAGSVGASFGMSVGGNLGTFTADVVNTGANISANGGITTVKTLKGGLGASISAGQGIGTITVTGTTAGGDLVGNIVANGSAGIGTISVAKGGLLGTITTTNAKSKITKLTVDGAVSAGTVVSVAGTGGIGTMSFKRDATITVRALQGKVGTVTFSGGSTASPLTLAGLFDVKVLSSLTGTNLNLNGLTINATSGAGSGITTLKALNVIDSNITGTTIGTFQASGDIRGDSCIHATSTAAARPVASMTIKGDLKSDALYSILIEGSLASASTINIGGTATYGTGVGNRIKVGRLLGQILVGTRARFDNGMFGDVVVMQSLASTGRLTADRFNAGATIYADNPDGAMTYKSSITSGKMHWILFGTAGLPVI